MTKMNQNHIIVLLLLVLVGAGGFFAGMKYQESRRGQFQVGQSGGARGQAGMIGQGRRFGGAGGAGFRPVAGEILTADDKSITVKLQDGSSKIVLFSDKTAINKAAVGSKDDLKVGERVAVFGQDNSDGSITAQNIQLNPMFRGMMGTPEPTR